MKTPSQVQNGTPSSLKSSGIESSPADSGKSPDHLEICHYSTRLIEKLQSLDTQNTLDFDLIKKAIGWAKYYHGDQMRKSGEPFYTHPLQVAYMISEYKLKTDVIVASILHDIIEDTEVTAGMLVDHFGWRIAEMVDMLTRDRPDGTKLSVEEILNNAYHKQDKEVLLVKVMDRLHNIETIDFIDNKKKRKEIIIESLENFIGIIIQNSEIQKILIKASEKENETSSLDELFLQEISRQEESFHILSLAFQSGVKQKYIL